MKKKWVSNILIILFVLVFVGCGAYLLKYYMDAKGTEDELSALSDMKTESLTEEEDTEEIEVEKEEGKKVKVLKKYKKLYKKNPDMIGWVTIPNTKIDYPVMQTKNDSEYYLHRNFKKEYDVNGLPFLDAKSDLEDEKGNLMLYGHHMKSGLMFAGLLDFESKSFYQKHKTVYLDTLYEEREYEVIAAFYSQVYNEDQDVFKYYNYPGHVSEKQFKHFVKNVKKLSLYDTGITPEYGEQLLMLVTCSYQVEEGRFVVVARRKK